MKKNLFIAAGLLLAGYNANGQFWDHTDPEKLSGTVNTEAEENMPVFSKDSSTLYFVRSFDPNNKGGEFDQDIWSTQRDTTGAYIDSKRVKELNNKFNNAVLGMSTDGTRMYIFDTYEGKKDLEKGIAVTTNNGGSWGKPEKIEIPGLDIEGAAYGFHVNEKEDVIIIAYEGPGTLGQEDLYITTKSGGSWSQPMHMGNTLNTTGYEISPFLSKNQDTLYFSSNGHGGQGDADIFYSVKGGSWTDWSEPVNLGNRINSPKFDAYFIHSGDRAFWSSNREAERADIYMIQILTPPPIELTCSATDATVYQGTDGSVDAMIEGGAPPFVYSWSNGFDGQDLLGVPKGEYTLTVTDEVGQTAEVTCAVDEPEKPIDPVVVKTYENPEFMHNFGYNKNKLSTRRGALKDFVQSILAQFEDGRDKITINIYSSASQVPTKTYGTNDKLAQMRAENMKYDLVEYFTNKGMAEKVNVVVSEAKVQGPAYEDDSSNRSKYEPFQYVKLKTE
jgi:hypothetical protein